MKTALMRRVTVWGRLTALFLTSVSGVAAGATPALSPRHRARSTADSPISYWQTVVTAPDRQLIDIAETASQCLNLADDQFARGYWRLSLLRSGAVKYLRPPVEANWAAAILALKRGEKLAAADAKRGIPVPAAVRAALVSRRAIFILHSSRPGDQRAVLRAIAALRRAISIDPKSVLILSELGALYPGKKGDMYARAAIKLDPRCTEAYWDLAGGQVSAGDVAAAIKLRIKALTLTRYSDPAYSVYDYHSINFWTKAMAAYIKAVRPQVYRKIRGRIAYFSPSGIPYSDAGRILARETERKPGGEMGTGSGTGTQPDNSGRGIPATTR